MNQSDTDVFAQLQHQPHRWLTATGQILIQALGDAWVFIAAAAIAFRLGMAQKILPPQSWNNIFQNQRALILLMLLAGWLAWCGLRRVYIRPQPFWVGLQETLRAIVIFAIVDLAVLGLLRMDYPRRWWAMTWGMIFMTMPVMRAITQWLLGKAGFWQRGAFLIGGGTNAWEAWLALRSEPAMGLRVQGFLIPPGEVANADISQHPHVSWQTFENKLASLRGLVFIVALDNEIFLDPCLRQLAQARIDDVRVIPGMRGVPLYGLETTNFFSHEVLLIYLRNNLSKPLLRLSKRIFDILISTFSLLIFSPLFVLLTVLVSRDGGKPFYGHQRIGQNGRPFTCYKFRSMAVHSQQILQTHLQTDPAARLEWARDFKLKNDPRVTRIGHFLRRSSLDELPQLWNVLIGQMSLVGPRPVVHDELLRYGADVGYYLMVKPGMTGLWQISGRNDVDYDRRVYFDSWYVKNWSMWSDIVILFKTVQVVLNRSGAY